LQKGIKGLTLQRVFHGIRFILRLVKIACRDDKQFFLRLTEILLVKRNLFKQFIHGISSKNRIFAKNFFFTT